MTEFIADKNDFRHTIAIEKIDSGTNMVTYELIGDSLSANYQAKCLETRIAPGITWSKRVSFERIN
ncbi:MAG: hypothetical protein P4L53_17175 [Candidatus Obscuribacterales bacterium]|nr:hypothetical protein [Candidatus Obscuribacterales bacterium]